MQTRYERLTDTRWQVIKPFLNYQRQRKLSLRHVHATNQHDSSQRVHLLEDVKKNLKRLQTIMADKTYKGSFAKAVEELDIKFEVPQRPEGTKGFMVETNRWMVERSFAWLNFFRRTTKDYERITESVQTFVILASTLDPKYLLHFLCDFCPLILLQKTCVAKATRVF